MAYQPLVNLDSGLLALTKINENFTEVYDRLESVGNYDAVGDGVTDDITEVLAAIAGITGNIGFPKNYLITVNNSNAETVLSNINRFVVGGSLTISVDDAVSNFTDFVDINNSSAVNISIVGAAVVDATIVSIGAVTGSAGAWSVPITVDDSTGMTVGRYVQIVPVGLTGTGRYKEASGTWKITANAANVVTMKNTHQQAAWPTMTLTGGTLRYIPSTLVWAAGSRGVSIYGCQLGSMENVVLAGSFNSGTDTPADGYDHGLQVGSIANNSDTGSTDSHAIAWGSVYLDNVAIVDWPNKGLSVSGGKVVSSSGLSCCGNGWRGAQSTQAGSILGKFGSYCGNGASGVEAEGQGFFNASGSFCAGNLTDGVFAIAGQVVFASSGYTGGNDDHGINIKNSGYVSANGSTSQGNTLNGVLVDMGTLDFGSSSVSTANGTEALKVVNGGIANIEGYSTIDDFDIDTDSGATVINTGGEKIWDDITKIISKSNDKGGRFTASTAGDLVYATDAIGAGTFTDRIVFKSGGNVHPSIDDDASFGIAGKTWSHIYANDIIQTATATGGAASAGAGNQHIVVTIGGVNYKLLHDGTV